jgi:hypothetical protein
MHERGDYVRGRLIEIGWDAKNTIAIATAYPIRSAAIVVSKITFSASYNDAAGIGEKL